MNDQSRSELWLPVADAPGYEVSSLGRVRSWRQHGTQRIKASRPDSLGYRRVDLYRHGRKVTASVHALVAEAFHGRRPDGLQVRHLDGNPANNEAENLAYGTASENNRDKRLHGTDHNATKTHCKNGHLFDVVNTYCKTTPEGHRRRCCRACNRAAVARYKARAAA